MLGGPLSQVDREYSIQPTYVSKYILVDIDLSYEAVARSTAIGSTHQPISCSPVITVKKMNCYSSYSSCVIRASEDAG